MKKKDLKSGLLSSLKSEEDEVAAKFQQAEDHFTKKEMSTAPTRKPESKKKAVAQKPAAKTKPKKEAAVRDSFTMPVSDHALFQEIQLEGMKLGIRVNKSEILRAALRLLRKQSGADLSAALKAVEKLKRGKKV